VFLSGLRCPAAEPAAQLFVRYCVRCHGEDGRGGPGRPTMPVIPDFTDPAFHQSHTDTQMMISILEGKDRLMPANRGPVTDEDAAALVPYIRKFGPARPGPEKNTAVVSSDFGPQFKQLMLEYEDLDRQIKALPSTPAPPPAALPSSVNVDRRSSAPGADVFFAQNCAGCHTIGGGAMTGPDLRYVTDRKDRGWLVQYLQNPKAVIDKGDPYVLHLLAEARGVVMPKPFGMTRDKAETLLDFITAESKREKSQFAGPPVPDTPFPPGDAARGRELFTGRRAFANGGPACVNCHTASGLSGRSEEGGPALASVAPLSFVGQQEGGRLGPDLTKAYERLGGRTSLTARLWAPATPTMQPLYKDHALQLDEVMCLVAYLEEADRQGVEQSPAPPLNFFLLGLGGAVLGLAVLNVFWRTRRPAWRSPLFPAPVVTAARLDGDLAPVCPGKAR
jgi:mono/diheme cytochrome c family protein